MSDLDGLIGGEEVEDGFFDRGLEDAGEGGHGWGMNPKFRYYGDWQKATLDWLSTL